MKKILAMVLAMMLVLSMSAAFADETTYAYSTTGNDTITFEKDYEVKGATDAALYPEETLSFKSTLVSSPTTDDTTGEVYNLTVTDKAVKGQEDQVVTVTLPTYHYAGEYTYEIVEVVGTSQGVEYDTKTKIGIKVLVSHEYDDKGNQTSNLTTRVVLSTAGTDGETTYDPDNKKIDTIVNTYNVGSMSVKKTVSGNLASKDEYFTIKVTFASGNGLTVNSDIAVSGGSNNSNPTTVEGGWTGTKDVTIYLKAGDVLTFDNIPDGVTYTVAEDDKHKVGDDGIIDANKPSEDYTVSVTYADAENKKVSTSETAEANLVTVNNDKSSAVNTGISLDNAPYMILMALVVIAGAALIVKRASANR